MFEECGVPLRISVGGTLACDRSKVGVACEYSVRGVGDACSV